MTKNNLRCLKHIVKVLLTSKGKLCQMAKSVRNNVCLLLQVHLKVNCPFNILFMELKKDTNRFFQKRYAIR